MVKTRVMVMTGMLIPDSPFLPARLALVEAGEMDLDEADPETLSKPDDDWRGWDREAWALAAREYHANRRGRR